MSIAVPTAGGPVLDTWGAAVANQLNRIILVSLTADQATNSATAVDVTEWTFPAVAGSAYVGQFFGRYSVSATNQGLRLTWDGPSGNGVLFAQIGGNGAATTIADFRTTSDGTMTGSTASSATSALEFWLSFYFVATASGDYTIQFARGGTSGSTGVTLRDGSGGFVLESS